MRKTIVTAIAAFIAGSVTAGVLIAQAQPAGSPMQRYHGERGGWRHGGMMRAFALVHRAEDRKLTPPDVKKIAEAFLLWNGNHSWQVLNVAAVGDTIGFDLATAEGSLIARFTMDPQSGRLTRRE